MVRPALLAVVGSCVLLAGCLRQPVFANCDGDATCTANGVSGHCEADHACSVDDSTCPESGRRYVSSAPNAGACTAPPDAGVADTPDGPPSSGGRECIKGGKRTADTTCAMDVCAREPRCCSQQWDATCVRMAETMCQAHCSTMAFVGGDYGQVFRTDTWTPIWDNHATITEAQLGGYWADFDDDGDDDVAIAGYANIYIYRTLGFDGTSLTMDGPPQKIEWGPLATQRSFNEVLDSRAGAWADIDGDGDLDLAVGGLFGLLLIENRSGTLVPKAVMLGRLKDGTSVGPTDAIALAWGDVDGDHDLDLVVGHNGFAATLYLNDGLGELTLAPWAGPPEVESVQFCNVDQDPEPEVVIGANGNGGTSAFVYELTGSSIAAQGTPLGTAGWAVDTLCGDLDGDGDLDLFAGSYSGQPRAYVNQGNAAIKWLSVTPPVTSGATPSDQQWGADIGDLDGDGDLDAVASGRNEPPMSIAVYRNTSPGADQVVLTQEALIGTAIDIRSRNIELGSLPTR
ncbi:MAG: VCBS repeat-containing protein [Deltaproteobacteria bacterium]|nr:VCBS repeat-containing protein [Deltaproteobacteria bacterium]